jgi:transmembrane sensor
LENNPENNNAAHAIHIASLIHKQQEQETLTEQEEEELNEWRQQGDREGTREREELLTRLMDRKQFITEVKALNDYDSNAAVHTIFTRLGLTPPRQIKHLISWRSVASVAAIFLLAIIATWMLVTKQQTIKPGAPVSAFKKDIPPGGNKAVLTLANGARIVLDTSRSGMIASQGTTNIVKLDNGRLAYQSINEKPKTVVYNSLSTPRGGTYRLTLPDGSQVWLNAASSITYPTAFSGAERTVKITGEAYIEVAHNSRQPFRVQAGDQLIEDIGTSFNVNAYADEQGVRTTLVEGKVKVSLEGNVKMGKNRPARVLSPGQQLASREGDLEMIPGADIDQVLAWKNGAFSFRNADLPAVMRQLTRWYDIEVEYEGAVPGGTFNGEIGRGLSLNQVLQGLSQTRIHYTIVNAHKIIIRP